MPCSYSFKMLIRLYKNYLCLPHFWQFSYNSDSMKVVIIIVVLFYVILFGHSFIASTWHKVGTE